MVPVLLAVAIVVIAALVAMAVERRRRHDPPTQPRREMPTQLDRADFADPDKPWLVVVFSSDSCSTCADVIAKARVLRSADVAVDVAAFQTRRDLHERYAIDAVPCLVVAGPDGAVAGGFLGPVSAADLWATVAEARNPSSIDTPGSCDRHQS